MFACYCDGSSEIFDMLLTKMLGRVQIYNASTKMACWSISQNDVILTLLVVDTDNARRLAFCHGQLAQLRVVDHSQAGHHTDLTQGSASVEPAGYRPTQPPRQAHTVSAGAWG